MLGSDTTRLGDDFHLATLLGATRVLIDVPWAEMQPRGGMLDGDVIEATQRTLELARDAGLDPWCRLLQPSLPHWFDNEGGFADARMAGRHWPRWVEAVADELGDLVAGWVPFDEPYALAAVLSPGAARQHGDLLDTLVVAWRDAWRILRGGPPVATGLDVAMVRPANDHPKVVAQARRTDQLRWGVWLDGLTTGNLSIPGRADRELPDLAGACDIVGLAITPAVEPTDLEAVLFRAAEMAPDRPLALTFRATGTTDALRCTSIEAMWRSVHRSSDELRLQSVLITPFIDTDGSRNGLVTREREPKDSAHSFFQS